MASDVRSILALEVPVIVLMGERRMKLSDVIALAPGSMIELGKSSEEELTLLINNKSVGMGTAVKVGENFGIRVTYMGDLEARIAALGDKNPASSSADADSSLADAMLAGQ